MGNLQITKLGIIEGGVCERMFKRRQKREEGSELAINWLLNHNCIGIQKNGWCKITKIPKQVLSMSWIISNVCHIYGGDAEIGWHRFIGDIAQPLYEKGKSFRLSQLKKWGASLAALEFALTTTIKAGKFVFSKPHQDEIYRRWVIT